MIDLLLEYGAVNACCMTGGGSSVMLYRDSATGEISTVNSPSLQQKGSVRMPDFWLVSP